jgi:hypothetical protein
LDFGGLLFGWCVLRAIPGTVAVAAWRAAPTAEAFGIAKWVGCIGFKALKNRGL